MVTMRTREETIIKLDLISELQIECKYYELRCAELELEKSEYKSRVFGKYTLTEKLEEQIRMNRIYRNKNGFDGFCYHSIPNGEYRTLKDMCIDGIITNDEYEFCNR